MDLVRQDVILEPAAEDHDVVVGDRSTDQCLASYCGHVKNAPLFQLCRIQELFDQSLPIGIHHMLIAPRKGHQRQSAALRMPDCK